MNHFWPGTLAEWFAVIATLSGAVWALLSFRRNNRIKAAEILINIEKEYSRHIPTLLQLENLREYNQTYRDALRISCMSAPSRYTKKQSEAIDRLEAALRHFFVCANVRWLSVDSGAIDRLCAWYLRVFVTDTDERGECKRPELREYIRHYWPTIYFWAPLAPAPWPRRLVILVKQLPERLTYWWTGSWAKPPKTKPDVNGNEIIKELPAKRKKELVFID